MTDPLSGAPTITADGSVVVGVGYTPEPEEAPTMSTTAGTIWTKRFWQGAGERAIKTVMQTGVAAVAVTAGTDLIPAVRLGGIDWPAVISLSALAGILSFATSIGNADFTAGDLPIKAGEAGE